jgi:hypothetical protein
MIEDLECIVKYLDGTLDWYDPIWYAEDVYELEGDLVINSVTRYKIPLNTIDEYKVRDREPDHSDWEEESLSQQVYLTNE